MLCWATRVASQVLAAAASGTMPRATATIRTTNVADLRDGEMRHADCEACGGGAEPRGRGEVSEACRNLLRDRRELATVFRVDP